MKIGDKVTPIDNEFSTNEKQHKDTKIKWLVDPNSGNEFTVRYIDGDFLRVEEAVVIADNDVREGYFHKHFWKLINTENV